MCLSLKIHTATNGSTKLVNANLNLVKIQTPYFDF